MSKFICDLGIKRVKQAIPSGDETIYYIMNVPLFRKVKSKNQCAIYIYKLKLFKLKRVSKLKALNQAIVQLNKNNEAFQKELHFLQKKYEHLIQEEKSQIEVLSKNISKMYYNNVFLLGANKYWKEFLQNNNYHYKPKDIEFNIKDFFEEYCQRWIENYSSSYNYNFIKSKTPQDFITTLKSILVKGNKK